MPSFAGLLRRGGGPRNEQPSSLPGPPQFADSRRLPWVRQRPSATPGQVKTNVETRPLDILRAHGDDTTTPVFGLDLLHTYAVLGGVWGDFDNPVTLRPYPVKVNRWGAAKVLAAGLHTKTAYEGTVNAGANATVAFNPAPSSSILIANDGTTSLLITETDTYYPDGTTPDFRGRSASTYLGGFVNTEQVEMVGLFLNNTSASNVPYRIWVYS